MRRVVRRLDSVLQSRGADRLIGSLFRLWVSAITRQPPDVALRRLLVLDGHLFDRIDLLAIDLDGGIHAKHRLIGYHEFFVERVHPGESVLDVGCGKGELANDLVTRAGATVTGIDVSRGSLAFAREHFVAPGLEFVEADVLDWRPPHAFVVVVLSNVLEHIEHRVELLTQLRKSVRPQRILIRVPMAERDWLVPLRRELDLPYFSDPTHHTEYTVSQLHEELGAAGLEVVELVQRWGELWATAQVP
jgi:ubiquinone/menaquinone biosynthesis C-methylase UbiE